MRGGLGRPEQAGSYFRAQYGRRLARRGKKRAIVAVANSLLTAAYFILGQNVEYRELGEDYFHIRDKENLVRRSVKHLERLGYAVVLRPAA